MDKLVRQFIEETVNYLIQTELDEFLGYQAYDRIGFNSGNSRNGSYTRTIDTQFGSIEITIP